MARCLVHHQERAVLSNEAPQARHVQQLEAFEVDVDPIRFVTGKNFRHLSDIDLVVLILKGEVPF